MARALLNQRTMLNMVRFVGLLSLAACSSAACAPQASDATAADSGSKLVDHAAPEPLCDGSDALRLTYTSAGGGSNYDAYMFAHPYGHMYVIVDGKCRYYAAERYMHGIVSGTLSVEEAEQLSADLHWDDLDRWASWKEKPGGCADASFTALSKAQAVVGCLCNCRDDDAPAPLGDALQKGYEWMEKLMASGEPLGGPVSAVVQDYVFSNLPGVPVFDWPLARPIDATPELLVQVGDPKLQTTEGPWALFDDPEEVSKLRELRRQTVSTDREGSGHLSTAVMLRNGDNKRSLYVRDELPLEVAQAWSDFQTTLPKQ